MRKPPTCQHALGYTVAFAQQEIEANRQIATQQQQLADAQTVLAVAQKQPASAPAPATSVTSEQITQAAGAAFSAVFAAAPSVSAQRSRRRPSLAQTL